MPSRLLFDLGATVSAEGTATMAGGAGQQQPASSPTQGTVTVSLASGTGTWSVEITRGQGTTGSLIGTGQGHSISQAFILLRGELVQVSVSGATAGTGIVGSVLGTQDLNQNSLPPMYTAGTQTDQVNATLNQPIPLPVSDGGVAGAIASNLAQTHLFLTGALTANATTTISAGAGTPNAYPPQAASWLVEIVGLANLGLGCRLFWQGQDAAANVLYTRQRDSSVDVFGTILASGHLDAEAYQFQITLPAGANGCTYRIYTSALLLPDQWFDTAIYGPTFTFAGALLGMDGVLEISTHILNAGASTLDTLPTYRGPVFIGQSASVALTTQISIQEYDYTGALLRNNFPVAMIPPGTAIAPAQVLWLGGTGNVFEIVNTGGSTATFFTECRAIKDLS